MSDVYRLMHMAHYWDESTLTEVYDTYAPRIYRYVYRRIGNADTAQDLTSETFHHLLEAVKRTTGPCEHLSGWLYRVAHNLIVDYYRSLPADPPTSLEFVDPADASSHDHHDDRDHRVDRVRVALRMLPPLQQQVIALRFLEELNLQEVADIMDRTVGSVKALQHRAVTNLQQILEETYEAE